MIGGIDANFENRSAQTFGNARNVSNNFVKPLAALSIPLQVSLPLEVILGCYDQLRMARCAHAGFRMRLDGLYHHR